MDFHKLLQIVFLCGPNSVNNYLALRVVNYIRSIRNREYMDANDYKEAVEIAPPMLKYFAGKYAQRGLKGILYTLRMQMGLIDGDLLHTKEHGCLKWKTAISSCYILYNILYVLGENMEYYEWLKPEKLESPFHNHWGLLPYDVIKTNLYPPFVIWHYEWQISKPSVYSKAQVIFHIVQRAIYIAWKKQCRRALIIRKLWRAHLKLADRISRLAEKMAKTHRRATNIRDYRDRKFL